MSTFEGKTAVVTGAGRGIGRAIALALASEGAAITLVARTPSELDAAAAEIRAAGGSAVAVVADLGSLEGITKAWDSAGDPDILVNNAAVVWPLGAAENIDPTEFDTAMRLNVTAPAILSFKASAAMVARGWGRIVDITSGVVLRPHLFVNGNAYATTKTALEAHMINLAAELGGTGVTVNAYDPGTVDTSMQEWIREQDPNDIGQGLHGSFMKRHVEGTLISPQVSAEALVRRLAGDESGQVWRVGD